MKLNKNKIIVSALALVIGTSLAGSVTGTLAWYQYSTRANVSFIGQSSGISGNLQMRFAGQGDSDWTTRITWETLAAHINGGTDLKPMTFGGLGLTDELPDKGYTQPLPGQADMTDWYEASDDNYAQFELELRYVGRDGVKESNKDEKNLAREVYLSKLIIQPDASNAANKADISDAVRLHIAAQYDNLTSPECRLISKNGGSTITHGVMDLDGDGKNDTGWADGDEWGFGKSDTDLQDIDYGDAGTQVSLNYTDGQLAGKSYDEDDELIVEETYPACVKTNNTDLKLADLNDMTVGTETVHKYIGKTMEDESHYLTVTVTIWVEGWHRFNYSARTDDPKYFSIWDADLANTKFDLGIQFAVQEA